MIPSSQRVEVTNTAIFTTIVTGVGPFTYQWKHNGTIINKKTDDTLIITDVMESDSGNYQCTVTNQFGYTDISNVVLLTVTSKLANNTVIIIIVCYYWKIRKITRYHSTANEYKN